MAVEWSYFDKFEEVSDEYLPMRGEGETMASQIVTAVTKLVYKWYNDGDVFDNVHSSMQGWCNDLSSYANWLFRHVPQTQEILCGIEDCECDDDYEELLKDLADLCMDRDWLDEMWGGCEKVDSIYKCSGPFEFDEYSDDDGDEDYDY